MKTEQITLDSYECKDCGEWSHHEQIIHTAPHGRPKFCPYCASESIEWRSDELWQLVEADCYCMKTHATAEDIDTSGRCLDNYGSLE